MLEGRTSDCLAIANTASSCGKAAAIIRKELMPRLAG